MWLNCRHGLMFSTAQTSEERALKYSFRLFVYRCNRRALRKEVDDGAGSTDFRSELSPAGGVATVHLEHGRQIPRLEWRAGIQLGYRASPA